MRGGGGGAGAARRLTRRTDAAEAFDYLDAPAVRVTGADVPMPYSEPLERTASPQLANVVRSVKRTLGLTA